MGNIRLPEIYCTDFISLALDGVMIKNVSKTMIFFLVGKLHCFLDRCDFKIHKNTRFNWIRRILSPERRNFIAQKSQLVKIGDEIR